MNYSKSTKQNQELRDFIEFEGSMKDRMFQTYGIEVVEVTLNGESLFRVYNSQKDLCLQTKSPSDVVRFLLMMRKLAKKNLKN